MLSPLLLLLTTTLLPLSSAQGNPIDISACLRTCIRKYNSKCDDLDVLCICKLSSTGPFLTKVSQCYSSNCDDFLTITDLLTAIEPICQLDGYPIPDAAISSAEAIGAVASGYGSGVSASATSELSYTLFAPIPGAASSTTSMYLGETTATTMHLGETSAMSTPTASVIPLASLLSSIPGSTGTTATPTATILPLVGSSTVSMTSATGMSMTTASSTTSPTSTVGNATPFSGAPGSMLVSGILGLMIPLVVLSMLLL